MRNRLQRCHMGLHRKGEMLMVRWAMLPCPLRLFDAQNLPRRCGVCVRCPVARPSSGIVTAP